MDQIEDQEQDVERPARSAARRSGAIPCGALAEHLQQLATQASTGPALPHLVELARSPAPAIRSRIKTAPRPTRSRQ